MQIARVVTPGGKTSFAARQPDGSLLRLEGDPLAGPMTATTDPIEAAQWLPPIEPRVIMCIGKNYAAHAKEMESDAPPYPVLFMKNLSAATGHQSPIRIPSVCGDEVDFEGELAVVIGKAGRDIPRDRALDHVLGYTCANDVSARIWQKEKGGTQWNRGKSFDNFAPLGPVLVTADEFGDPAGVTVRTIVSGEEMQCGNTANMIFDIPTLIAFLSQDTTLLAGTVILTGTPEGVGWARHPKRTLRPGDEVRVIIDRIGELQNPIG